MIPSSLVGMTAGPLKHIVDERWTMAYAAALGETLPIYFDTTTTADNNTEGTAGIVAHPVFAVCPEWPVIVATRDATVDRGVPHEEVLTSVHATHDVVLHRLIRPGDELTTTATIVAMVQKSPGAMSTIRLETVDAAGHPVATTTQHGIYLGVRLDGDEVFDPDPPTPLGPVDRIGAPVEVRRSIDAGAAHTYTECARIWNPIHTDRAVALAAGLPDIILHGTANLAHGVSAVIDQVADGDPHRVCRVIGRFAAMVQMPCTLTVHIWPAVPVGDETAVPFEVLNAEGHPAVKDGLVVLSSRT